MKEYVVFWLTGQQNDSNEFYHGGNGETLLVIKGEIIDFIKYPGQIGLDQVRQKLTDWKYIR